MTYLDLTRQDPIEAVGISIPLSQHKLNIQMLLKVATLVSVGGGQQTVDILASVAGSLLDSRIYFESIGFFSSDGGIRVEFYSDPIVPAPINGTIVPESQCNMAGGFTSNLEIRVNPTITLPGTLEWIDGGANVERKQELVLTSTDQPRLYLFRLKKTSPIGVDIGFRLVYYQVDGKP